MTQIPARVPLRTAAKAAMWLKRVSPARATSVLHISATMCVLAAIFLHLPLTGGHVVGPLRRCLFHVTVKTAR